MPQGSRLRELVKGIVREAMSEIQQQTQNSDPERGVVAVVNSDGTVDVQTTTTMYSGVGAAVVFTLGAQVLVITADGKRVAIPR